MARASWPPGEAEGIKTESFEAKDIEAADVAKVPTAFAPSGSSNLSTSSPEEPGDDEDEEEPPRKKRKGIRGPTEADRACFDAIKGASIDDVELAPKDEPVVVARSGQLSRLKSINGVKGKSLSSYALMRFCALNKIGGYRNKSKKTMCDVIVQWKLNKIAYAKLNFNEVTGHVITSRAGSGNYFRLINCLFHDEIKELWFAAKIGENGEHRHPKSNKDDIIASGAGESYLEDLFEAVEGIYNQPVDVDDKIDRMQYYHTAYVQKQPDPAKYINKTSRELHKMYKVLESEYTKVYMNSEDNQMVNLAVLEKACGGNLKLLYFHQYLQDNPRMLEIAVPELSAENSTGSGQRRRGRRGGGTRQKNGGSSGGGSNVPGKGGGGWIQPEIASSLGEISSLLGEIAANGSRSAELAERRNCIMEQNLALRQRGQHMQELKEVIDSIALLRERIRALDDDSSAEVQEEKGDMQEDLTFFLERKVELKKKLSEDNDIGEEGCGGNGQDLDEEMAL